MRSRPNVVKSVMKQFPPQALVRVTQESHCAKRGACGVVQGYNEDSEGVCIIQLLGDRHTHKIKAEHLELIDCPAGVTPAMVEEILNG